MYLNIKLLKKFIWWRYIKNYHHIVKYNIVNKKQGISVCIRINNNFYLNFLENNLRILDKYVDEIIIHYNSIDDEWLKNIVRNNNKITIKGYPKNLDFVEYTNDFLKEHKYKWFMMLDGDVIILEKKFSKMIKKIKESNDNAIHYFQGISIFFQENKFYFSNLRDKKFYLKPIVGNGDFFCFCPEKIKCDKLMVRSEDFKIINGNLSHNWSNSFNYVFDFKRLRQISHGICFIHLSFIFLKNKNNELLEKEINNKNIIKNISKVDFNYYNFRIKWFYNSAIKSLDDDTKEEIYEIVNKLEKNDNNIIQK